MRPLIAKLAKPKLAGLAIATVVLIPIALHEQAKDETSTGFIVKSENSKAK